MGGPKPAARRLDGRGARTDGMSSSTTKPKQSTQAERARRSGKPANLKVEVKNLEASCPNATSTSPVEKHIVNPQAPKGSRARSASSFLQPDQFIAELKVKTGAGNRSELTYSSSPGSARSTRSTSGTTSTSVRSSKEPRNGAPAREPTSLPVRKSPKPRPSNRTQPVSQRAPETTPKRESSVPRRAGSSVQRSPTPRAETGLESLSEPANSVPTLELSYEGKPAPAPAHLRVRTGHSTNSTPQPSLTQDGDAILGKFATAELQKSPSHGSGRFSKGASAGLQKLHATSARLGRSCSPAKMREKLVRSVSGRKEGSSREDDSRAVHSFHAGTSTRPHSQSRPAHSLPIKSLDAKPMNDVEGDSGKPAGRLRRMVQWGASKTGLEVLKSLERKLGKKSSKVSSGTKNEKMGGGRAEQMETTKIDAEREIREVTDRSEKIDDEIFDGNCSARSSVSSVSTTYSDVSSKSHSYKHSHHKKNSKSEVVKSKLWLLRVHQKRQGRQSKESEEDSIIYDAVHGATLHSTADATFKDEESKKRSPGSARFNLEKNAISKLVAKHKRNSTWDAGKLSPNDHLFSPKQPRLPKSDAHILLAPPKKLTINTGNTEFQQRRGIPSTLDSSSSPRTVSARGAPEHQVASRPNSRTTTPARTRPGQSRQAVALPAVPTSGAFLQAAALMLASPDREKSPVQGRVSPARSEVITPPISPGALPTSSKSSFRDFKGLNNSPLPLPVRVGRTVGSELSPPSPIYPASQSPGRFASPARAGIFRSTPTSPGLYALPPSWTGLPSPTRDGVSSTSPGSNAAQFADGAGFQNSLVAGLDATTSQASSTGEGSNGEEIFVLANSSFDSTSSSNSSLVLSNSAMKPPDAHQEGTRMRSRSPSPVGRNGFNGPKADEFGSSVPDERESSDKQKTGRLGDALSLRVSPRSRAVSFEQIVAGRGRSPPTDNTLMKFFFKCREIEHLNKFLALQKKRFLESFNTESKKCFHMILSESGRGLSSMISTLCMAWLLENKMASALVKWHPIPVMNMSREEMWQHRDAAWLFHVCGVDANAVLFLDEITSNNGTVVAGRVKRAVAGQDILVTKDEVASSCTIVSEKFRQEAPKLLQARYMKTLLLAGILVDTENLSTGSPRDKQQATILLVGAGSLGRNGFYKHLVSIRDEDYVTTFIKEIYGDSNALTGENPVPRGQGVERPKSFSASSQSHEKAERAPPSRPAPLRPPPLEIPSAPSEVSPSISPIPPVPLPKPITELSRKSEVETKLSRKSEVEAKRSRKSEVEAKRSRKSEVESSRRSRKSMSEVENGDSGKVSSNKTESMSQNSKISFGLRRFRNRSSAQ